MLSQVSQMYNIECKKLMRTRHYGTTRNYYDVVTLLEYENGVHDFDANHAVSYGSERRTEHWQCTDSP